jgi:hypothetical protein
MNENDTGVSSACVTPNSVQTHTRFELATCCRNSSKRLSFLNKEKRWAYDVTML